MNEFKKTKRALRLASIFVFCGATIGLLAIVKSGASSTADSLALAVKMTTTQRIFLQGEPIPVNFELLNGTASPVGFIADLGFGKSTNLVVRRANGIEVRWTGDNGADDRLPGGRMLPPGDSVKKPLLMEDQILKRLFSQPGNYQVRLEFKYVEYSSAERVERLVSSEPISIEIEEPRGIGLLAFNHLRNFIEPERHNWRLDERLPALRYFADNFRVTPYWKYLAYELGNLLIEKEQYLAAEDVLYDISDIDFFYSKRVEGALSFLAGKLKRGSPRTRRILDPSTFPRVTYGPPYVPAPGPPPPHIPPPVRVPVPTPTPENVPEG